MAMRLICAIETATDVKPSLLDIFQGITIAELCRSSTAPNNIELARGALTVIRSEGWKPAFFAVGSHPRYTDAASEISSERPIYRLDAYALQAQVIEKQGNAFAKVEQICTQMVEQIKSVQPVGQYTIGGGCEGAILSFHIAAELQRRGDQVDRLILWITPAPGSANGAVFGEPALHRLARQLRSSWQHVQLADLTPQMLKKVYRHQYMEYCLFRAMDQYAPSTQFVGEIAFARVEDRTGTSNRDDSLCWNELATGGAKYSTFQAITIRG